MTVIRQSPSSPGTKAKKAIWHFSCDDAGGCEYRVKALASSSPCVLSDLTNVSWTSLTTDTYVFTKSDGDGSFVACGQARG